MQNIDHHLEKDHHYHIEIINMKRVSHIIKNIQNQVDLILIIEIIEIEEVEVEVEVEVIMEEEEEEMKDLIINQEVDLIQEDIEDK